MPILEKEQFESLSQFKNNPCISIFIPTERAGKEVLNEKDRIHLKSEWKKVSEKLKDMNLPSDKIEKIGKPIEDLIEDTNFWRHQSDGLAIFAADGYFEKFTVPVNFEAFNYFSDHFYLKPLIPFFNGDGRFYILSLQIFGVKLYEATRYSVGEVYVEDLTPSRLEDRVGYDYEQKNSQHETQNEITGTTVRSSFGNENQEKNEYLRFFRAVDKGLHKLLRDERVPLVVACQDYLFPLYKEANTYQHLFEQSVPGNPDDYDSMLALHSAALEVLNPYFDKEKDQKMEQFREMNPSRTSTMVSEIIPAIFQGKVDTLFLQNREDIWGKFNEPMASVEIEDSQDNGNISLMNLAAVKVIEQGGQVFLIEDQFMPDKSSKMNAVFRY